MAITREPAWRIFAHEFNKSDLQYNENDERSHNFIISPTGARINRLFVVGVLTELENIGKGEDLWRARIADPTGVFTIYAGSYQPNAAALLSTLEAPQFIALVGKARIFKPNDASLYVSIRPKEINISNENARNNWIITTAERTLDRLEALRIALDSSLQDEGLRQRLLHSGISAHLADGIARAVQHYDLQTVIEDMSAVVERAINTVVPSSPFQTANMPVLRSNGSLDGTPKVFDDGEVQQTPVQDDDDDAKAEDETDQSARLAESKALVVKVLETLDSGSGVPYDILIQHMNSQELTEEEVEDVVKGLMDDGKCYEPKLGILKLI